jgi:hypothetical protein
MVGDIRYERTGQRHTDCGWRIDSAAGVDATLDDHIGELLNLLWESREYLQTLRTSCQLQANIVIHCNGTAPPMELSTTNIERLASLHAGVDIDLYC